MAERLIDMTDALARTAQLLNQDVTEREYPRALTDARVVLSLASKTHARLLALIEAQAEIAGQEPLL